MKNIKIIFFLLTISLAFAQQSNAAQVVNLGTNTWFFNDSKGDHNIVFMVMLNNLPQQYTWVRQKRCDTAKTKGIAIFDSQSAIAVKFAADSSNFPALEALAPKDEEKVD